MNNNILHLEIVDVYDDSAYEVAEQFLVNADTKETLYICQNLSSEDATIGRDLFSCLSYAETLKAGMDLVQNGYDGIDIQNKEIHVPDMSGLYGLPYENLLQEQQNEKDL
jgi:hypothetical protein